MRAAVARLPDRAVSHRAPSPGRRPGARHGRPGASPAMTDVTRILLDIGQGDAKAAERLLPLVYEELRRLAAQKLAHEKPGQTLQATALVHEAYLRLLGAQDPGWNGRGHFFAAAAEAMRRILVGNARRKAAVKAGAGRERVDLAEVEPAIDGPRLDLLAFDEALA